MGHHHGHHNCHQHHLKENATSSSILLAFFLNASFAIIELIGGTYCNSISIVTDAIHDFGDSISLLFAYFAEKYSKKSPDKKYTYGYRRFSILGALINIFILFGSTLFVLMETFNRLKNPQPVDNNIMLILAIIGVGVNGFAAYKVSKNTGISSEVVSLHLLEDMLGWLAVLILSIVFYFKPWYILDPILALIIAFIILRGAIVSLKKISSILLQSFPKELSIDEIEKDLLNFKNVLEIHSIRGWSVDESSYSLSFHVLVPKELKMAEVDVLKDEIIIYLQEKNIKFSNIQFESNTNHCQD